MTPPEDNLDGVDLPSPPDQEEARASTDPAMTEVPAEEDLPREEPAPLTLPDAAEAANAGELPSDGDGQADLHDQMAASEALADEIRAEHQEPKQGDTKAGYVPPRHRGMRLDPEAAKQSTGGRPWVDTEADNAAEATVDEE